MKKQLFIITTMIIMCLCVSCDKIKRQPSDVKTDTDIKLDSKNDQGTFDDMEINEIILLYLEGDWIEYSEGEEGYTFVVKSIDEIYQTFYGHYYEELHYKDGFIDSIEKGDWEKENIIVSDEGFQVIDNEDDRFIDKYIFDFSKVENNNINDIILHHDFYFDDQLMYSNDFVRPGKEYVKTKPSIGMTHEEVLESTWGEPYDINKTTYEWGTTEQWCYYGSKYIYFENGKVTTIQE